MLYKIEPHYQLDIYWGKCASEAGRNVVTVRFLADSDSTLTTFTSL